MYRGLVSLLLLPCLLLSRSAAFGHSHGGGEPAGHNSRPHLHVTSTPNEPGSHHHHRGHHHGPDGHHHHHEDGATPDDSLPFQGVQNEPISDHDSDVIYLGEVDAI